MLDLALNDAGGPVPLSRISERQDISLHYLEQLFNKLKNAGIVRSRPGAGGGYMLARSPREITVGDIIRVVEGPIAPVKCTAEDGRRDVCPRVDDCVTHVMWKRLGAKIENFFDSVTIKELCDDAVRFQRGER